MAAGVGMSRPPRRSDRDSTVRRLGLAVITWPASTVTISGHPKWNHLPNKSSSYSCAKLNRVFVERTLRRSVLNGDGRRPQRLLPGLGSTGTEWKESRILLGTCSESGRVELEIAKTHLSSCARNGESHGSNLLLDKLWLNCLNSSG